MIPISVIMDGKRGVNFMRLPPTENRFNRHERLRSGVGNDGLKNQLEILEKEIARVSIGL